MTSSRHQSELNDAGGWTSDDKCIHELFEAQAQKTPKATALIFEDLQLSYGQLNARANQLAHHLRALDVNIGTLVAVYVGRSLEMVVGLLGILKAGGTYVPLDPDWPCHRTSRLLKTLGVDTVVTTCSKLSDIHQVAWDSGSIRNVCCLDGEETYSGESELNRGQIEQFWDFIAATAKDEVSAGGFINSYTNTPFTKSEVQEYTNYALKILDDVLVPGKRILEIGYGSGAIAFALLTRDVRYIGIDPSTEYQQKNRTKARQSGYASARFEVGYAHEASQFGSDFDAIIIASVTQFFPSYRYLERVLDECVDLLAPGGVLLIADVIDPSRNSSFVDSLRNYKSHNRDASVRTEHDSEFHVVPNFFESYASASQGAVLSIIPRSKRQFSTELVHRYDVLIRKDLTAAKNYFTDAAVQVRTFWPTSYAGLATHNLPRLSTPDHTAYVIFTSGSTGEPKGVMVQHRPAVSLILWVNELVGVTVGDRLLFVTSLCFDLSVYDVFGTLAAGGVVDIAPSHVMKDPERLAQYISSRPVTFWDSTPAVFEYVAKFLESLPPDGVRLTLKTVFLSGDWIPLTMPQRIRNLFSTARIVALGGATEATIWSNFFVVKTVAKHWASIPYGKPIRDACYYILDDELQIQPIGVAGDLYIGGDCLAIGYFGDPGKTAEKFIPDPYHPDQGRRMYWTGDLARRMSDDNIEFLGRTDLQVKLRGFRIELGEIENALLRCAGVREAVVVMREDQPQQKQLVTYLVPERDSEFTISELRGQLKDTLPEYMMPSAYVRLERLPLTPNGKVDRRALPAPGACELLELGTPYVGPRTPTEELLAGVWANVLQIARVGINDGFLSLGGTSMQAMEVSFQIARVLGTANRIAPPLKNVTIAQYAPQVETSVVSGFEPSPKVNPAGNSEQPEHALASYAQEQIRFLEAMGDAWRAYRFHARIDFDGRLDVPMLQRAINALIERHEILRTAFIERNSHLHRELLPRLRVTLPCIDLSDFEPSERTGALQELIKDELERGFDCSRPPLVRWLLIQLSPDRHVLIQSEHHFVHDGQSFRILLRDLGELYTSLCDHRVPALPPIEADYGQFCLEERRWLQSPDFLRQRDDWLARVNALGETAALFTDRAAGRRARFFGDQLRFGIDHKNLTRLNQVAADIGVSRFALLFAAFAVLCSKYSQTDRLLIGTAIANRVNPKMQATAGMFVNMLPIPIVTNAYTSFTELARSVGDAIDFALLRSGVPLAEIVKGLGLTRRLKGDSPFNVAFSCHDSMRLDAKFKELDIRVAEGLNNGSAKFDLDVVAIVGNETSAQPIEISFEYSTDLFERPMIERMAIHYQTLLEAVVSSPEARLQDLPMLTDAELDQLVVRWNDTQKPFLSEQCIHELFEAQVARTPDAIAVVFEGEQLTYRELNERANQLAHYLRSLGAKPDTLVAICVERSLEMIIGLFGILKAGGAYVPLDPEYPVERLAYMLEDTAAPVLVTQARLRESLPKHHAAQVVCIDSDWATIAQQSEANPSNKTAPQHLAYCIYTSGSTGNPKGVAVAHGSVCAHTFAHIMYCELTEVDRVLQFARLSFDASVEEIVPTLVVGARLVLLPEPFGIDEFSHLQLSAGVTVLDLPTAFWHQLAHFIQSKSFSIGPNVRLVVVGGEAVMRERLDEWLAAIPTPRCGWMNTYGPTETTISTTFYSWRDQHLQVGRNVSIGRPLANTQIYILDESLNPSPIWVTGEIHIAGVGLARGYLNRPELTAEKFIPNPFGDSGSRMYRSGDLARYLPDGNIEFVGRKDDQVKIRGFRIELGEIESTLQRLEYVSQAVVVAHEDSTGDKRLVAYVVAAKGAELTVKGLRRQLQQILPEYMVPTTYIFLAQLPLNSSGKIDRRALPVALEVVSATNVGVSSETVADTQTARQIVEFMHAIVPTEQFSIDADFFDAGFYSLNLMRLIAKCRSHFNVGCSMTETISVASPRGLANLIDQRMAQRQVK